ncbi:MAG: DUF2027 domain-containing protein [Prevotella sp.]|nr:DUF2027 domain-containing protein [Prevotella sp.]
MVKKGDKVRFLNETGGGIVAGFQGKSIVLVEDEDGFLIPTTLKNVVVIGEETYDLGRVVQSKVMGKKVQTEQKKTPKPLDDEEDYDPSEREITFRAPAVERKGGDQLSVFLAFVPMNPQEMTRTRFETYLVNDSNYYVRYVYMTAEGSSWHLRSEGEVEPNTKLFVEEFGRESLNEMERVAIQLMAYKRERPFLMKDPVMTDLRIDPVKFYKLHTFRENDFFEQTAMVMPIVENDRPARPLVVDARRLKEEMYDKKQNVAPADKTYVRRYDDGRQKGNPFVIKRRGDENLIVVDLHAEELLENMAGMKPADILNYQLDIFRRTLTENAHLKGQKVVFIHGKGEGVLRSAIIHELKYRFKGYTYQDASFQEYGYGATQVTIR